MSTLFKDNVTVLSAERKGNVDRYGAPTFVTVATLFRARLEKRTIRTRGSDGVVTTLDGTIMIDPKVELEAGDRLTMDNDQEWDVFDVDESMNVDGAVEFRTYGLTKQRKKD